MADERLQAWFDEGSGDLPGISLLPNHNLIDKPRRPWDSPVLALIHEVWRTEPDTALKRLRARIRTSHRLSATDWGTWKVAAKRLSLANGLDPRPSAWNAGSFPIPETGR
ncbi:MAG: hypothetical protein AAB425_09800, partial [Bdellovibrionota bacterium]